MAKMICVKDQIELQCKKNGVTLIETFGEDIKPYKLWRADLYECPMCGYQTISGFSGHGITPIAEHFDEEFEEILGKLIASGNVFYSNER